MKSSGDKMRELGRRKGEVWDRFERLQRDYLPSEETNEEAMSSSLALSKDFADQNEKLPSRNETYQDAQEPSSWKPNHDRDSQVALAMNNLGLVRTARNVTSCRSVLPRISTEFAKLSCILPEKASPRTRR